MPNYYSGLTIAYVPCNRVKSYSEDKYGVDYVIDDECIADEAELYNYLKTTG